MELRHLRYFLAVAQAQSFSRAAERLHIAQPPLSRQIRQLEDELGAELFDRSARPLALTPAGLFLQSQAQLLLDRVQEVRAGTSRIARGERRWFGIGFVPSALYGGLPTVIRRFREARPNVEVGLLEMTTVQQIEALKAGRIDVGFGRLRLADDRISGEVVRAEAVVAALPTGHALAAHRKLSLVKLVGEPLLLYPAKPRPSYADQVLEMFRSRGLAPTVALEANEMQTALGLAAAGIGYVLVPEPVTRQQREGLVYRPMSDPGLYTPLVMNCRAGDESALLRGFREMVHTVKRERDAAGVPDGTAPPAPA